MQRKTQRVLGSVAVVVLVVAALGTPSLLWHLRALYVLLKLEDANARPPLAALVERSFVESEIAVPAPGGPMRARLYQPAHPAGTAMVVVHGVHFDGIDDPRMRRFARALAGAGIPVLTPHVTALTELRVEPSEIESVGAAAQEMQRRTGRRVGVFGLSFAGGLALLAAADERYRRSIAYVFAVGAHHDMARVARYYATDEDQRPAAGVQKLPAHPYGAMILIYTHPEDFFSPQEAPIAKEALRLALQEKEAEARAAAARLSPPSRALLESLAVKWQPAPELRAALLQSIEKHKEEFAAVSPAGKLDGVRSRVYLLHGAGDNVIPSAESEWLAQELGITRVRALLISPVISHVETETKPTGGDEVELVHFLSQVLSSSR
jgi:hypothetical protein